MEKEMETKSKESKEKLWNGNFVLLLQGQAVSMLGDKVYGIALPVWILAQTGSVALMSVLMAAAIFPKIFVSPFAGTFIDRHDRKKILIISDVASGVTILFIGMASIMGFVQMWMIVAAGIIEGTCSCFLYPTINSTMPDVVPKTELLKANSIFSSVSSVNDVAGYAFGGFLVQIMSAPVLFLFDGASFLFSAFAESFVKIPQIQSASKKVDFMEDMRAGMRFVNDLKGLKCLYITIAFMNFVAAMSMTLTLPWFKMHKQLGVGAYGMAMAINTLGTFAGFAILSVLELKKEKRFFIFMQSGVVISITMILYAFTLNFHFIAVLFFLNGICLAVMGSLLQSSMQNSVPSNMRSKVFAFRNAMSSALMPLGMILAGALSKVVAMNVIIFADYAAFLMLFACLSFSSSVKEIMNM